MRGDDAICGKLFSHIDLEKRIRADHPLRVICAIANAALKSLSGEFQKLYSPLGRELIPPQRLMRALLLQAFYSIHSERLLVERIDHDLLFRWQQPEHLPREKVTGARAELAPGDVAEPWAAVHRPWRTSGGFPFNVKSSIARS